MQSNPQLTAATHAKHRACPAPPNAAPPRCGRPPPRGAHDGSRLPNQSSLGTAPSSAWCQGRRQPGHLDLDTEAGREGKDGTGVEASISSTSCGTRGPVEPAKRSPR
ncbi:hypothetical protein GQ55_3G047900 [Panicum hallii var. hallii]|uniref:Uncharacterized protein n=1 Tax=Panicum hallii var. hallii TaxID=1504633 RepID=A0A2T7E5S7_9POAL|nr:hypothetical protein GQ55_3G047900 [Panicum hallii var. hallii]